MTKRCTGSFRQFAVFAVLFFVVLGFVSPILVAANPSGTGSSSSTTGTGSNLSALQKFFNAMNKFSSFLKKVSSFFTGLRSTGINKGVGGLVSSVFAFFTDLSGEVAKGLKQWLQEDGVTNLIIVFVPFLLAKATYDRLDGSKGGEENKLKIDSKFTRFITAFLVFAILFFVLNTQVIRGFLKNLQGHSSIILGVLGVFLLGTLLLGKKEKTAGDWLKMALLGLLLYIFFTS